MRSISFFGAVALIGLGWMPIAKGDLLINGGFESPAMGPGAFITVGPGLEPLGFGWSVSSGNVDVGHIPNPFVLFPALEGNQVLDLNGNQRGALYQDFTTVAGQSYALTFRYADNPAEGGVSSASILVSDVGLNSILLSDSVSHSTSVNLPLPEADADTYFGTFTAVGITTRLALASTSASNTASGGIILDAVSVSAIPEPSSACLMMACGLSSLMRRRRTVTHGSGRPFSSLGRWIGLGQA